jgi:hypothetical protein
VIRRPRGGARDTITREALEAFVAEKGDGPHKGAEGAKG